MSKKFLFLMALFVICLLGFVLIPTYAKFTSGYTTENDMVGLTLSFDLGISNIEEYEEVIVPSGKLEQFNVEISNNSGSIAYYGIWYKLVSPIDINDNIKIGKWNGTEVSTSGEIENYHSTTVTIAIINNTSEEIKLNIGVGSSNTSVNDIEYLGGKHLITGEVEAAGIVNVPNLDSGNLIPVVYDEKKGIWTKADSLNYDNTWYDYENKRWANAVLVGDSLSRNMYQEAEVGTEILENDIMAFYVWIPRFKYRVWNISRKLGGGNTYSYESFSKGIDIEFEFGIDNTGNVDCVYDMSSPIDVLSDKCIYNNSDEITNVSVNTHYIDAWYTHPAFKFGDSEKSGFWIGKFETTGSSDKPTVLPNEISLREQNVSEQFSTSQIFQSYGLSSNLEAHMLTNLEWGAVTYLMYSDYGLCSDNVCRDVYVNNSSSYYTGRSGGTNSSGELSMKHIYGEKVTSSEDTHNSSGFYTYDGYFIGFDGVVTSKQDMSKVASTTGNITGVYDLSGGASEAVMGNMLDVDLKFNSMKSGFNSLIEDKYYNTYSYRDDLYGTQLFMNSSRLGDATIETVISVNDSVISWYSTGSLPKIKDENSSIEAWFMRGGNYNVKENTGSFSFSRFDGMGSVYLTFRSSIS